MKKFRRVMFCALLLLLPVFFTTGAQAASCVGGSCSIRPARAVVRSMGRVVVKVGKVARPFRFLRLRHRTR